MTSAEEDPLESIEKHLWTAKEFLKRKFGKKQDEYIAASDSQLDAKLEYFKSLRESSGEMMAALRAYHNIMYDLSQKERDLSALLRSRTNLTKCEELQASMSSVGKALRDSSQDRWLCLNAVMNRLEMRKHFSRLADEVTTFRKCAVTDCEESVQKMEAQRTQYRGALSWMRDVSNNLNPDSTMNMYKFRRVQDRVKETKKIYDNEKITSLEKIDLLAISRQGMFSQTLGGYIKAIKIYHKHMASLYGQLENEVKVPMTIRFETLKELNDLMPELPPPGAATVLSSSAVGGDVALITVDGPEADLNETSLLKDDESDSMKKPIDQSHPADLLIDTSETSVSTVDDDSADITATRKSTTSSSELAYADNRTDLIALTADELLMMGDADDDQNDDIFTGLDDTEVQALKDVFALSAPVKMPYKGDGNVAEQQRDAIAAKMQSSSSASHAYRRILPARNTDKASEPTSVSSKSGPKKSDTGHGFLSFMPSLLQEAAAAAMFAGTSTTTKNVAAVKKSASPVQLHDSGSQHSLSSKKSTSHASSKQKNDGKPTDNANIIPAADDKAGLNSWFKLLEQVNLFEDEAECLLPQDGRRSSLGNANSTHGDNSANSAGTSLGGTPVRSAQDTTENLPSLAGDSAVAQQQCDEKSLAAAGAGDQHQQTAPPKPAGRAQYWLADDSAA